MAQVVDLMSAKWTTTGEDLIGFYQISRVLTINIWHWLLGWAKSTGCTENSDHFVNALGVHQIKILKSNLSNHWDFGSKYRDWNCFFRELYSNSVV